MPARSSCHPTNKIKISEARQRGMRARRVKSGFPLRADEESRRPSAADVSSACPLIPGLSLPDGMCPSNLCMPLRLGLCFSGWVSSKEGGTQSLESDGISCPGGLPLGKRGRILIFFEGLFSFTVCFGWRGDQRASGGGFHDLSTSGMRISTRALSLATDWSHVH